MFARKSRKRISVLNQAAALAAPPCCVQPLEQRMMLSAVVLGSEFLVNTSTPTQSLGADRPAVAQDDNGDFVVVWDAYGAGGNSDIFARRYNSSGTALAVPFLVNTTTTGFQSEPAVAMDDSGNFVVTWVSLGQDGDGAGVYAQRYNSSGVAQGSEFLVNSVTTGGQLDPVVAMDNNGAFVIAFDGEDGSAYGIFARRYNSSGVAQGTEFQVNTFTTGAQQFPSVAKDNSGDFVVSWDSYGQDGSDYGVFAQRYNSSGVAQGVEFQVNTFTTSVNQLGSAVAMDSSGNFVITWTRNSSGNNDVLAQRYNASGVAQGTEFVVNTFTTGSQGQPAIAMDGNGRFVISWQSDNQDGAGIGVFAQAYHPSGAASGGEFQVNTFTTSDQFAAAVAMDADSGVVVAWRSLPTGVSTNADVKAQRYLLSTTVSGSATTPSAAEAGPVNGVFTITRDADSITSSQTVNFTWSGTATYGAGADFVFKDASDNIVSVDSNAKTGSITIPANQTSTTLNVVPNDDQVVDASETVILAIAAGSGYVAQNPTTPTVVITDNDVQSLDVTPTTLNVAEGSNSTFSVVLTAQPLIDVVVTIAEQGGGDTDLTSNKSTLTFTPVNWNVAQIVTISDATDNDLINGSGTFSVSATSFTTQNVVATEVDDQLVRGVAPGAPNLAPIADTGDTNSDNITNLDNSSAGSKLTFTVPTTASGSTVRIYADGTLIGSTTATGGNTTVVTNGTFDLTDGTHTIIARQIEVGLAESINSASLTITIDTVAPTPTITQAVGQADPSGFATVNFLVSFSETVNDLDPNDFILGGTASPATKVVTANGSNTYIVGLSGMTANGTVTVNLPAGLAHDVAGNGNLASVNTDNSIAYTGGAQAPGPFTSLINGKLVVNGTAGNDAISLTLHGNTLTITRNGSPVTYDNVGAINRIEVYGLEGNDIISIGSGIIGTYVLGGYDNDSIVGGTGNDTLTGAAGKDTLIGGGGDDNLNGGKHNDRIFGGDGNDRLYGQDGLDYIDGGNGADRIYAGANDDTILGGNQNDTIYGEDGNDIIDSGNHNDHIFSGPGNDTVTGGNGNDVIEDQDSAIDVINGGAGTDSVLGDVIDQLTSVEVVL